MILKLKIMSLVVVTFLFVSGPVYSIGPWETSNEQTISNNSFWGNTIFNNTNTEVPTSNSNNGIWNNSASDDNGISALNSSDRNNVWNNSVSNNTNTGVSTNSKWNDVSSDIQSMGNTLRDLPPAGGPGDEPPGQVAPTPSPIGEGLVILILLSGGYFMLKRRYSKE